jgi:iron complex transport system ATP-binding protein
VAAVDLLVEFSRVGFRYPAGGAGFALQEVSFALAPGEILAVVGPNASGKTTLIRLLSRVVRPGSGEIRLAGRSLARLPLPAVARQVAVVPQDLPRGLPYTVEDLVLMGRFPHAPGRFFETAEDRRAARRAMDLAGVGPLAAEPFEALSGGERQRVALARALAQEPRVLALDEPTAHLDLRYQAEVVGLLRRLNAASALTVLLVSHDLNLAAEVSHRMLLMQAGRVAGLGRPEEVLEEAVLERVYGCRVVVDKHPATGRPTVLPRWPGSEGR